MDCEKIAKDLNSIYTGAIIPLIGVEKKSVVVMNFTDEREEWENKK